MNLNLWENSSILEIGNPIMYFESTGILKHRLSQVNGAQDSGCSAEFATDSDLTYGLVTYGDNWTIKCLILDSNRIQISKDGSILKEIVRDGNNPYNKIKIINNENNVVSFYTVDIEDNVEVLTLLHSLRAVSNTIWYGVYGEVGAQCTDFNLENSFLVASDKVKSLTFKSEQSTICKFEGNIISLIGIANNEYNFGKLAYEIITSNEQYYNLAIKYSGPLSLKINEGEEEITVNSSQLQVFKKTFRADELVKIELSINKIGYIDNYTRSAKIYDISLQQITGAEFDFTIGKDNNIIKGKGQLGFTFNIPVIESDGIYPLVDRLLVEGQEVSKFRIYIDDQTINGVQDPKIKFLYNSSTITLDAVIRENTYYSVIASWVDGEITLTLVDGTLTETKNVDTTALEYEIKDIQLFKQTDLNNDEEEEFIQSYGYIDNLFISTELLSTSELIDIRNGLFVKNKNLVCLLQFNEQGIANSNFLAISNIIDINNLLIVKEEDADEDIVFKKVLYDKDTLYHHIQYKYLGEIDPTTDLPIFPEPYTCFLVEYASDNVWQYKGNDVDNGELVFYYDQYYIEGFPTTYKDLELNDIDVLIDNTKRTWSLKMNNIFKIAYAEINSSIDIYYRDVFPTYMLKNTFEDNFQITTSDAIKNIYKTDSELDMSHLDLNPLNSIESSGFILASAETQIPTNILMYASSKKITINEAVIIKAYLFDQNNNLMKETVIITDGQTSDNNIYRFVGTTEGSHPITASFIEVGIEITKEITIEVVL